MTFRCRLEDRATEDGAGVAPGRGAVRASALAALAIVMAVGAPAAHAEAQPPPGDLAAAREGATVRLAPGVRLTVRGLERRGGVVRVRDGRLRLGRVAVGRGVRAVARGGKVTLVGGRFDLPAGLTDRTYTISSAAPLVFSTGADGAARSSGALKALPAAARARAAEVGEGEVEQALPAPVGAGRWRVGLGINAQGVAVRLFLGDTQAGSGLVRYDGSYRVSLTVKDLPALGARISVAGDVAGRNILQPDPITGLRGDVQGKMQLADKVAVGDGGVTWDADGMKVDAAASLGCQTGALDARVAGVYRDDGAWSFGVDGGTSSDGCSVADGATVADATVQGGLAAAEGQVTGEITARTAGDAPLASGTDFALVGPALGWSGGGLKLSAGLRLSCPAGGSATASVTAVLPHGKGFRDWSVGVGARVGATGCGIIDGLKLGPDTALSATIDSQGGRIGVAVDAKAAVRTALIPTKDTFTVAFSMRSRGSDFSAHVSGTTLGAKFGGPIARDGTFDIPFDLTDFEFAGANIPGSGRIRKSEPRAAVDTSFGAAIKKAFPMLPSISVRGGSIGFKHGRFVFAGTLRLGCSLGWVEFTASASIKDLNNFEIGLLGTASRCTLGKFAAFERQTLKGTISVNRGKFGLDLAANVGRLDIGTIIRDKYLGSMSLGLDDTYIHITNTCADGCGPLKLRVELNTTLRLGWFSKTTNSPGVLVAPTRIRLDLFGPRATVIKIELVDSNASALVDGINLEGLLLRALGRVFGVREAPEGQVSPASGIGDGPLGTPDRLGSVKRMTVRVRAGRPTVSMTLSRRAPVTVDIQRRACATCEWKLVAYRVVKASTDPVARFGITRLRRGTYRAVARVGSAGSGRPVARRFRVG